MSCIDAVPLSWRQVMAGLYGLLQPAPHWNFCPIPSLFSDFFLLGMFNCTFLTASITQRPLPGGPRMKDWRSCGRKGESPCQYFVEGTEKESAKVHLRSSLFRDVTQRRLVVIYWRFGATNGPPNFKDQAAQDFRSFGSIFEPWMSRLEISSVKVDSKVFVYFRVVTGKGVNSFKNERMLLAFPRSHTFYCTAFTTWRHFFLVLVPNYCSPVVSCYFRDMTDCAPWKHNS
jgi:hypothetical protein